MSEGWGFDWSCWCSCLNLRSIRTNNVVGTNLVVPASVVLACIDIKLHCDVLFALMQVELLDTFFAKNPKTHTARVATSLRYAAMGW